MALPQIDEPAGLLTGLAFLGFVLWKVWLRFKEDKRTDKASERAHAAEDKIVHGYQELYEQMREEFGRLAGKVDDLSNAVDEERRLRYEAERVARELRARVEQLERKLRELGHTP